MLTRYADVDFIGLFEPDPPWVYVPKENDQFLQANFLPAIKDLTCPYCGNGLVKTTIGVRRWAGRMMRFVQATHTTPLECEADLYRCQFCGWWNVFQVTTGVEHNAQNEMLHLIDLISVHWAKLKTFDLAAAQAPLTELQQAFAQRSAARLTETVAACFRNHFPCEVIQLRKPDLSSPGVLLIQAEQPLLLLAGEQSIIANADAQPIRDLLAITYARNRPKTLLYSLNARFQTEDVHMPVLQSEGLQISLTRFDPLLEALQAVVDPWEKIWQEG